MRAAYNKYGKDKELAPEGGFADPREYFQQMFGGDAFRSKFFFKKNRVIKTKYIRKALLASWQWEKCLAKHNKTN